MSLYQHLADTAAQYPHHIALLRCDITGTPEETLTYRELCGCVEKTAAGLLALGILPGERIALALSNPTDHLLTTWAAWGIGISVVPLDTKRDTKELTDYKIKTTGAKAIIRERPESTYTSIAWTTSDTQEALVLFTSGTTALPKGAILTLKNLLTNAQAIREWMHIDSTDRMMVLLPLHHINSTTFCLSTLLAQGSIAILPSYSNSRFWQQLSNTHATFTSIVQSILSDQLARSKEFDNVKDALAVRKIQIGSSPVIASSALTFVDTFGIPLYQGYGQTETALRVTGVPLDLSNEIYKEVVAENSIGVPLPWAHLEITDESGRLLGEGEEGELVVKGEAVMQGYVAGEEALRDGYFLTGDIGLWRFRNGQRFFYLKGRKKELIIKGGINISPVAIENNLQKISKDLEQTYVVGYPDARYGEVPAAIVCWKDGVNEESAMRKLKLLLVLGNPHLRAYETPSYLLSLPRTNLPLTSTGKVQRVLLKKQLKEKPPQPIQEISQSGSFRFVLVEPHSQLCNASRTLFNHCWQPLSKTPEEYTEYLKQYFTIAALDAAGTLAGQISFSFEHKKLECVSICSNRYTPKQIPLADIPSVQLVAEYLKNSLDPVIGFHQKLGAEIVEILPQGRPEDTRALGYLVRMRYSVPPSPHVDDKTSVSSQLIQTILLYAHDLGLTFVDALSRPGGLATYLAKDRTRVESSKTEAAAATSKNPSTGIR